MKITVRLFAAPRQIVGEESVQLEFDDRPTVAELRDKLADGFPELKPLLRSTRFAVDTQYVDDETLLDESSDVACIPPVSGG